MKNIFPPLLLLLLLYACKTPSGVFSRRTAHEQYGEKLDKMGLRQTVIGGRWFDIADKAISNPVLVQLPYRESGYFPADNPGATGLRFEAKRGEQLTIELTKTPALNYLLFADLFMYEKGLPKYVESLDTISNMLKYVAKENTNFVLRLQPELLKSASYTVVIKAGPSLAFPIASPTAKNRVISPWGVDRDRGARKHEGIDIGGARGTPVIAVGDGRARVTENALGGKVVFINADSGEESCYYAHLDSQIAVNGQKVKTGEVIGLIGNTGNAINTGPHLHFGIYTGAGAVDPLPYINPVKSEPAPVIASTANLGRLMRISGKSPLAYTLNNFKQPEKATVNEAVFIIAATGNFYRTVSPGGETRFIPMANLAPVEKRIKQLTLRQNAPLLDAPSPGSPMVREINAGTKIDLLANYGEFDYVSVESLRGWISLHH